MTNWQDLKDLQIVKHCTLHFVFSIITALYAEKSPHQKNC